MKNILIGNSFPLSLITRSVRIDIADLEEFKSTIRDCRLVSFWGHSNTLAIASSILGRSLEPRSKRPAIKLSNEGYPTLEGTTFTECWVLAPDYPEGFRPKIGEEVTASDILFWKLMKLTWL